MREEGKSVPGYISPPIATEKENARCRVRLLEGIGPLTGEESDFINPVDREQGYWLACNYLALMNKVKWKRRRKWPPGSLILNLAHGGCLSKRVAEGPGHPLSIHRRSNRESCSPSRTIGLLLSKSTGDPEEAGSETTYAQLNDQANRIATGLIKSGLRPGDLVELCAQNSADWIAFYFGVLKAGGVAVTLSSVLTGDELRNLVNHSRPRFISHDGKQAKGLGAA